MAKVKQNEIKKVVYLSTEIANILEQEAYKKGMTVSGLIRLILIERYNK